ncbi:hypothetical protein HU200_038674 [Digitaria exilis]|uniref:RING-type E3 ubiquitin transferase n=1 Tax=Digitaria exilis TaxID=1010633 RepID=A0A835BAI9_9POAL|nr:hypothetical protein HU200_038674 [Digitaria exilis]
MVCRCSPRRHKLPRHGGAERAPAHSSPRALPRPHHSIAKESKTRIEQRGGRPEHRAASARSAHPPSPSPCLCIYPLFLFLLLLLLFFFFFFFFFFLLLLLLFNYPGTRRPDADWITGEETDLHQLQEGLAGGGMGGMNMVTTAMAFSVSAFFVIFVFTRLLCARLHLSRAAAADSRDAFVVNVIHFIHSLPIRRRGYPPVERGIQGLEPSVVTTFPTVKLGDGGGGQQRPEVQEECTVCLEEYEPKDVVRVLPACGHAFHAPCIDTWLRQHPTCPVCRASLRAKGNRATPTPPIDYSLLVAGGGAAAATAAAPQIPDSSSDITAPPELAATDQTDMDDANGRLEIVTEEPGSTGDQSPAAAGGGGGHSPCAETARQSASGAGVSEHC